MLVPGSIPRIIFSFCSKAFCYTCERSCILNLSKIKINPVVLFFIKAVITLLCLYFIYRKIILKEHFEDFVFFLTTINTAGAACMLVFVFLLMILNWFTEAFKWKYLIATEENISSGLSFYAVLVGAALSFFTPNRVGEFAGRVLVLRPENRIRGALATIVGSISQLIITLLCGLAALPMVVTIVKSVSVWEYVLLIASGIVTGFVLLKLYFNIGLLSYITIPFFNKNKIAKYIHIFKEYSFRQLLHVLFLSFMRYMIFTLQFVLLFRMAHVQMGIVTAFAVVFVIFFVMTVIPSIALIDIAVRGSVALFILQNISVNTIGILAATFALWFINLVIPAIAGTILFGYLRIAGKNEQE